MILGMGLLTVALRVSFILLLERLSLPSVVQQGLRFVPVAVLPALVVPTLVYVDGELNLSLTNGRLVSGLVAIAVSWRLRSIPLTIAVGMGCLWFWQWVH
ncbi:MAG: AzlD domain-containing protein [Synechococcales bacterium]|nr:AzlD domain-containing protein [Synechococcales bacterium]